MSAKPNARGKAVSWHEAVAWPHPPDARQIRRQLKPGGRIFFMAAPRPVEVERHALWVLLTKGKQTPRGLDLLELRTIGDVIYDTFDATARAMGLIDDQHNHGFLAVEVCCSPSSFIKFNAKEETLTNLPPTSVSQEAVANNATPEEVRSLFLLCLQHGDWSMQRAFDEFWPKMVSMRHQGLPPEEKRDAVIKELNEALSKENKRMKDYDLPDTALPTESLLDRDATYNRQARALRPTFGLCSLKKARVSNSHLQIKLLSTSIPFFSHISQRTRAAGRSVARRMGSEA